MRRSVENAEHVGWSTHYYRFWRLRRRISTTFVNALSFIRARPSVCTVLFVLEVATLIALAIRAPLVMQIAVRLLTLGLMLILLI